ncbi:MAG: hypothetical protein ACPG7F_03510 [Aggregatilineales bacterium]
MSYHIIMIKEQLIYIYLAAEPSIEDDREYVEKLRQILEDAEVPIYFLIDFTHHITTRMPTIQRLAQLAKHPNTGASRAFGADARYVSYGRVFATFSNLAGQTAFFPDAEAALSSLAELQPGLDDDVNIDEFLLS